MCHPERTLESKAIEKVEGSMNSFNLFDELITFY
jgi:hypothetical protein